MAEFTQPLIEQLAALVYRDQATYLAQVGETETFKEFHIVTLYDQNFPALAIYDPEVVIDPDSVDTIHEVINIRLELQVVHSDRDLVSRTCRHYMSALHLLLYNAEITRNGADFSLPLPLPASLVQLGPTTAGMAAQVKRCRVVAHRFTQFGSVRGLGFGMKAEMDALVQLEENP